MSTRRGLLIVLVLIVLIVAGAVVSARAQSPITCEDGMCTLPQVYLAELVRQAEAAERYAVLCGWTKKE